MTQARQFVMAINRQLWGLAILWGLLVIGFAAQYLGWAFVPPALAAYGVGCWLLGNWLQATCERWVDEDLALVGLARKDGTIDRL